MSVRIRRDRSHVKEYLVRGQFKLTSYQIFLCVFYERGFFEFCEA